MKSEIYYAGFFTSRMIQKIGERQDEQGHKEDQIMRETEIIMERNRQSEKDAYREKKIYIYIYIYLTFRTSYI